MELPDFGLREFYSQISLFLLFGKMSEKAADDMGGIGQLYWTLCCFALGF